MFSILSNDIKQYSSNEVVFINNLNANDCYANDVFDIKHISSAGDIANYQITLCLIVPLCRTRLV